MIQPVEKVYSLSNDSKQMPEFKKQKKYKKDINNCNQQSNESLDDKIFYYTSYNKNQEILIPNKTNITDYLR